jgi:hypothetical protein
MGFNSGFKGLNFTISCGLNIKQQNARSKVHWQPRNAAHLHMAPASEKQDRYCFYTSSLRANENSLPDTRYIGRRKQRRLQCVIDGVGWCFPPLIWCWSLEKECKPDFRDYGSSRGVQIQPSVSLASVSFIHPVVYLTTDLKPIPKRILQTVRSSASSFNFQYLLLSLRSFSSCLRLLLRLPLTIILVLEGSSYAECDQSS